MSIKKMQYCAWCGAELGLAEYYEPDHCGQRECARRVQDMYRQEREEAQYKAEQDDYERYK